MKKILNIDNVIVFLLSLVGLFLRIDFIYNIPTKQLYDFSTYYEVADNIYNNLGFTFRGFPIAWQGMGYSTLLGFWFKLFNNNTEILAKWLNIVMSMATIYLVYYIVKKLFKSKFIIYFSTIAVIFLPNHIAYCNAIGTEVMSAFLLAGFIAVHITEFNWKIKYPVMGFAIGLMSLTKPFFMAYPLLLALVKWLKSKDIRETLKLLVLVTAFMILIISPWTLRNYKKFGRIIPVSYNSGFNLYINNNANNVHGGWQSFDDIYKSEALEVKINKHLESGYGTVKLASDIELDFKPEAKKWIVENPMEFLKLGLIRIHSTYFSGAWDIEAWTMNEYRKERMDTEDEFLVKRNFNFINFTFGILVTILSSFGLLFIIIHFKAIVLGIFKKDIKIPHNISIPFLNLSYISLVYFVYEGQPRYNFIVLFLLIITTAVMLERSKYRTLD